MTELDKRLMLEQIKLRKDAIVRVLSKTDDSDFNDDDIERLERAENNLGEMITLVSTIVDAEHNARIDEEQGG